MKRYIKYTLPLFAAVMLSGCLADKPNEIPGGKTGDYVEVEFTASMDDEGQVLTRALSKEQENYTDNIDILVFEYNGLDSDGRGTFLYSTHAVDLKPKDGKDKTFKAMLATKVKVGETVVSLLGKEVFLLVLANAREELRSVSASYGDTYRSIVDKLIYDGDGNWDASETSTQYFPMSSPSTSTKVTLTGNIKGSAFGTISLVRAVMAIDVGFNYGGGTTPQGFDNFKLEQVVLRKFPNKGYISGTYGYSWNYSSRVPSAATKIDRTYTLDTPSKYGIFNEMYLPITSGGTISLNNYQFLLIAGYYNGSPSLSWYRIDVPTYMQTPAEGNPYECSMRMERNNRFIFKIESIDGPGYSSPEEAEAGGVNLWANLNVVPWSERYVPEEIDGPYYFDISQREFMLDYSERDNTAGTDNVLTLDTDYSGGWKVDGITYEEPSDGIEWLSTNKTSGPAFTTGQLVISTLENKTGSERTGYIHLSAGRWKYTVTVTQATRPIVPLIVDKNDIYQIFDAVPYKAAFNKIEVFSTDTWSVSVVDDNGVSNPSWLKVSVNSNTGLEPITGQGNVYALAGVNTTGASRKAFIHITNGSSTEVVEFVQGHHNNASCGIAGVPAVRNIGKDRGYETHLFGRNPRLEKEQTLNYEIARGSSESVIAEARAAVDATADEWIYRCWMVENSVECISETSSYVSYTAYTGQAKGARGYYYSYSQATRANNACPTGWRLPTMEESEAVRLLRTMPATETAMGVDADVYADAALGGQYLQGSTVMRGGYYDGIWRQWDRSYWWSQLRNSTYWLHYIDPTSTLLRPSATGASSSNYMYLTVRCVEDVSYSF